MREDPRILGYSRALVRRDPYRVVSEIFLSLRLIICRCKCDSMLISPVFARACSSRISAMCTIIISDNYLVFLEPHALSVLKVRTELYARRGVRVFSLIWCVRINFSRIVRQDVAIVTLHPPASSRLLRARLCVRICVYVCVLFSFPSTMMRERSELLF